jgi:hypothetical protein
MMVYDAENYWVSELCPSSGILNFRKHNVWDTGSVPIQGVRLALRDPTVQVSSCPHLGKKIHPVSETLCFLVSGIPDDGQIAEIHKF